MREEPDRVIRSNTLLTSLGREILRKGKRIRFRAFGGSMRPFIRGGDIVEIEPADIDRIREGDVAFYFRPKGGIVLHRVVSKKCEDQVPVLTCQGDASMHAEGPIYPSQIMGRAVSVFRGRHRRSLNAGGNRFLGRIWARLSPHRPFLMPIMKSAWGVLKRLNPCGLLFDG
jgi:hypothetical protein